MKLEKFLKRVHLGGLHEKFIIVQKGDEDQGAFAYTRTEDKLLAIFADTSKLIDTDKTVKLPIYESSRLIQMLNLVGDSDVDLVFDEIDEDLPVELLIQGVENKRKAKYILADSSLFSGEPFAPIKVKSDDNPDGADTICAPFVLTSESIGLIKKACAALGSDTFVLILSDDGIKIRVGGSQSNNIEIEVSDDIEWKIDTTKLKRGVFEATFQASPILAISQYCDVNDVMVNVTNQFILIDVEDLENDFTATYLLIKYHKND